MIVATHASLMALGAFDLVDVPQASQEPLLPEDDYSAISAWLREFARRPNTLRAYRREARRFWLWLSEERGTTLRALTRRDLEAYRDFLKAPPSYWVAPAADSDAPRTGVDGKRLWRPLQGPLDAGALRQALIILQALFSYLVDAGHVKRNVFRLVRDKGARPQRPHRPVPSEPAMTRALTWLRARTDALAAAGVDAESAKREMMIWAWCYWCAARRHEVGPTRRRHIQLRPGRRGLQWFWEVMGKGEKLAYVPLDPLAVDAIAWSLGCAVDELPAKLTLEPERHLFPPLRGEDRALSVSQVYDSVVRTATLIASNAASMGVDAIDAALLAKMLPHDLRAARNTHLLNGERADRLVQRFMRHADINTTLIYDHTTDEDFHQGLFGLNAGGGSESMASGNGA